MKINNSGRTKTGTIAGQQNTGSTISRVIIKNIEIKDYANKTGGVAGESSGTIEEVSVENLKISYQHKNNIGGIVGFLSGGKIERSFVDGEIGANTKIGGIAGNISGNSTVANSYADVDILSGSQYLVV